MSKSDALSDPRVAVDSYIVYPTGYEDAELFDKDLFKLVVSNGHLWGWSIRQRFASSPYALNKKGKWIYESRGSQSNRFRRYSLEAALTLALKYVDDLKINGLTLREWEEKV